MAAVLGSIGVAAAARRATSRAAAGSPPSPPQASLSAMFGYQPEFVAYPYGELDTLAPAFTTTIHKSRGSEYPAVVIPVVTQHYTMLARNLLYTGVTRGKRLVVLVGQRKAVGIGVRGGKTKRRWTKLREWLVEAR